MHFLRYIFATQNTQGCDPSKVLSKTSFLLNMDDSKKNKNIDNVVTVAWLLVIISVCNIYSWSSFREWEKNISCYLY